MSAPSPTTPGITGYSNLTDEEKALMNAIKAHGQHLEALVQSIRDFHTRELSDFDATGASPDERIEQARLTEQGQHWLLRGVDDLQDGLMKLTRSVARPTTLA